MVDIKIKSLTIQECRNYLIVRLGDSYVINGIPKINTDTQNKTLLRIKDILTVNLKEYINKYKHKLLGMSIAVANGDFSELEDMCFDDEDFLSNMAYGLKNLKASIEIIENYLGNN